jgi:hypothetical protein
VKTIESLKKEQEKKKGIKRTRTRIEKNKK